MPFPLIPTTLAIGFLLVWLLIVGMLLRDGQIASRRERESKPEFLPLPLNCSAPARSRRNQQMNPRYTKSAVRAAS
jgi:hypothetical protein